MALEQVAQDHYRRSTLTTRQVVAAVLAIWRTAGPSGFRDELTRAAGLIAAGQLAQAVQAAAYLVDVAAEQGLGPAAATLNPRTFAGVSADGRPLVDVLSFAVSRTWTMLDAGADYATANTSGMATLTRIAGNEVTQAGISAEQVGMTGHTDMGGYIRLLEGTSCGRCAVLAGKWFQWNQGFARHPSCDCKHVPSAEAGDVDHLKTNSRDYFDSLSTAEQDRRFGPSEAEAIRGGTDLNKAVNASTRRGSRSGLSTPRSIDRLIADRTRDEAVADLTRYGYLTAA